MTGNELKAWREDRGWSQVRTSREFGCANKSISRYEARGDRAIPGYIARLAEMVEQQDSGRTT